MAEHFSLSAQDAESSHESAVSAVVDALKNGDVVVIPTDTSYALCADAFHAAGVKKLRELKGQNESISLPVVGWSVDAIGGIAKLEGLGLDLAHAFWPGALTILTRPQASLAWSLADSDQAMPVRVPNSAFVTAVLRGVGPTVMTGAQRQGGDPLTTCQQAIDLYGDKVAVYVDGGQAHETISSVVDATGPNLRLVRSGAISLAQLREVVPVIVDATASRR